ncbi:MAG: hypothetical protein ABIS03_04395 [Gemmatimonadaceae bacterium]
MKQLVLIAAVVAMSACSPKADNASSPVDTATAVASSMAAAPEGWTGFEPATYDVTGPDGTKVMYVIKDDGTFSMTDPAGKVTTGSIVMKDGKGCVTPTGGTTMCWKNDAPGADGSWSATADDGAKATVMKRPA